MVTKKTTSATTEEVNVASTYTAEVEAVESATSTENEIVIEKNDKYNFFKITCTEGHYLTTFNEGDDITLYSDSKEVYTPLTADTSKWHCVTEEEHVAYIEARDKAIEERMEAERAAMMSDRPAPMQ